MISASQTFFTPSLRMVRLWRCLLNYQKNVLILLLKPKLAILLLLNGIQNNLILHITHLLAEASCEQVKSQKQLGFVMLSFYQPLCPLLSLPFCHSHMSLSSQKAATEQIDSSCQESELIADTELLILQKDHTTGPSIF